MTHAGEVATELRRIADALDKEPSAIVKKPMLSFYCGEKEEIINLARLLPRPLAKTFSEHKLELEHDVQDCAVWLRAVIDRNKVCEIIEPAKPAVYHCEPLLSPEEEEALA